MSGRETRDDAGYVPFGGLPVAAPDLRARELVGVLRQHGVSAAVVGEIVDGAGVRVAA
ncbi:MAG: Selenide,water dikinase @ selenocysteine-containing [uncultured Rubrobacteraceae bacterium]|uniref:Selenide,water dikinase @ selenocysteine-containing n=1 Tax=uncultured Rubrobacteraceae bacterium TaxID=349277 RepID=A0A6J4R5A1_9ACTN|nr:MAG: Selenide,water dikinase @ selenocysteine-containing [uncultured Rubrobacteraceae bacterium]